MRVTAIALLLVFASCASAKEMPHSYTDMPTCVDDLLRLDMCALQELYRGASAGPVPTGYAAGRVIPKPGKFSNDAVSKVIQWTVWQGKHFTADGMMTNNQFGVRTNRGKVYGGPSILDGKPVHVIDYRNSWSVWQPYFDEFREVSPGIYLGITWRIDGNCPRFITFFALDARKCGNQCATEK